MSKLAKCAGITSNNVEFPKCPSLALKLIENLKQQQIQQVLCGFILQCRKSSLQEQNGLPNGHLVVFEKVKKF